MRFQTWASPVSLAATRGILVGFFSSADWDASVRRVILPDLRSRKKVFFLWSKWSKKCGELINAKREFCKKTSEMKERLLLLKLRTAVHKKIWIQRAVKDYQVTRQEKKNDRKQIGNYVTSEIQQGSQVTMLLEWLIVILRMNWKLFPKPKKTRPKSEPVSKLMRAFELLPFFRHPVLKWGAIWGCCWRRPWLWFAFLVLKKKIKVLCIKSHICFFSSRLTSTFAFRTTKASTKVATFDKKFRSKVFRLLKIKNKFRKNREKFS